MKNTSLALRALFPRGTPTCPAFFWRVATIAAALLGVAPAVRADLIVLAIPSGGGFGQLWRFETGTGTAIGTFSPYAESLGGLSVTREGNICVTSDILGYDGTHRFTRAGIYLATVAGGDQAWSKDVCNLPDGSLACLSRVANSAGVHIVRLDRPGGSILVPNGTGGMLTPLEMVAGPDGNLYVLEQDIGIMRFSGTNGAFLGVFVPLGRGGLSTPYALTFGPDRHLYVSTRTGNSVLRYDGSTGAFLDTFVSSGSGGLNGAMGLAFGPDQNLFVASYNTHQILRYNGTSGAFIDAFVTDSRLRYPSDVAFTSGSSTDVVWFEDGPPAGATVNGAGWQWTPSLFSGSRALSAPPLDGTPGPATYAFNFAAEPLLLSAGDSLVAYVAVPGSSSFGEIMLSWFDGTSWEHRAYWGGDLINEGQNGTPSRRYLGRLDQDAMGQPPAWYRLEVPAALVGLEGRAVYGMGIVASKGTRFDRFGKAVAGPTPAGAPDKSAPVLDFLAPANGGTVTGWTTIAVRATDNSGAGSVRLYVDGTLSSAQFLDGNNIVFPAWNTTAAGNGPHVLRVTATDGAGNTSEISASVTVNNTSDTWWLDDNLPPGAWGGGSGGDTWNWVTSSPPPVSGTRSHQSALASGLHEHYFSGASSPLMLGDNDLIVTYVYIDPANPPREIMLSFFDGTSWEHRAYWGDDLIPYGTKDTASRRGFSPVWRTGEWVRLEVAASSVGLAGRSIAGVGFAAYNGRVTWDALGKAPATVDVTPPAVAITAPAGGATVAGVVTITATASDNERMGSVTLYVDGRYVGYDFEPPYSFAWDTATELNGSHTIRMVASDTRGNNAEQSITVTVNNDSSTTDRPPTLRFTAPAAGASLHGTVRVSVDATDDHGVAWVAFQLPGQREMGAKITAAPFAIDWDTRTVPSGSTTIYAWAADARGQQAYLSLNVIVDHLASGDTAAPTISITSPASGATVTGDVPITVAAADNYGMSRVAYYVDGNAVGTTSAAPYDFTWNSRNTTNTGHTLQAVAYDLTGHTATATATVTVNNAPQDSTNPVVLMTAPANDATVSGNVTVTASASDNVGIASVQFYLDGAALSAADPTPPYSIEWDSRTAGDGSHVLSAIATDTGGRTSQRSVITVNVNNTGTPPPPPGATDIVWFDDNLPAGASIATSGGDAWNWVTSNPAPTTGTRAHQSNLATGLHEHAFDWAYAGAFTVASTDTLFAWVYLDPAAPPREIMLSWRDDGGWEHRAYWGANLIGYGQDGTAARRRMGDLPAAGVWTKLLVAADSVGLGASQLLGMSFAAFDGRVTWDATGKRGPAGDTNLPSVAITAPAGGSTVSGNVTVTATTSDNTGVVSVQFFVDNTLFGQDTSSPFSVNWATTTLADGYHNLKAVARDAAGNQATSAVVYVEVKNVTADTSPPSVYFGAPDAGANVSGLAVTVSAFANDNVGVASVRFMVDGTAITAAMANPPFSTAWNSTTVSNGTHTLTAVAVDLSGNQATATRIITVNNPTAPVAGTEFVWVDDNVPSGAVTGASGGDAWNWIYSNPSSVSGWSSHQSTIAPGMHEHFFGGASAAMSVGPSDVLFAYIYVDPANPPREIMLSWFGGNWEHRAYWGENLITYGTDRTASRFPLGALPPTGQWVRLEIPAYALGFATTTNITGMSFTLYGGRASWDRIGRRSPSSGSGDTAPPTAALLAPAPGASVSGSVSIDLRFTDDVAIRRVAVLVDGREVQSSTWNQPALGLGALWDSRTVANGSHTLAAQAWDAAGNTAVSSAAVVTVNNAGSAPPAADTALPTVTITAPANNATVSGNVTLTATATDNVAVASVAFRVDGSNIATATTPPYSATWNTAAAANGSHAIAGVATDTAGNQATSATVIVSVNNPANSGAVIWMDSAVPPNATTGAAGGDAWTWVTSNPAPFAGTRVHQSAIASGTHEHYFIGTTSPLQVFTGDTLFVYVYVDPANAPREIMLSFNDGTWEHRAYWGSNEITYGTDGTNSRRSIGALPVAGQWVKLEVPARLVGLEGRSVNGMSFTLVGGRASWDIVGRVSP